MKTSLIATVIVPIALLPFTLRAQWPDYKTGIVPRDATGKPILDGPTPKAPDGHPDLSGVWTLARNPNAFGRGAQAKGGPPPGTPPPAPPEDPTKPPLATFKNIGSGFKDGCCR